MSNIVALEQARRLKKLGFDTWGQFSYYKDEIKLNDKAILCMDAFWDFYLDMDGHGTRVGVLFTMNEELEDFINAFK